VLSFDKEVFMERTRSRASWLAGLFVVGLGLTTASGQAIAQQPGVIQIAWSGPLTGDVAQLGQGYLNGAKLAIEEWNEKGGVLNRKIVVAAEDDACDPKQAGPVATKIADDPRNVAFIGHFCSGTTLAGAPIINKVNLPMITGSSNPTITQQGWKNLVRVVPNDNIQGRAIASFAMRNLGVKRFAILNDKQAMGQGVTDVAKATVERAGGTVTSYGGVEPKDVDFSPVLTKIIRTENPDTILYCTNFPTSAGLIVKQTRQLGFKKPIVGCDGFLDPGMIKAAGNAANHVSKSEALYFTFQAPPYTGPEAPAPVRQFAAKYKAKYGKDPNGWEAYGYDAGNVTVSAIEKAGSTDKEKIIDALHSTSVQGVLIPEYRFDEHGDVVGAPMYVYTVEQGSFKLIEQFRE
jgi:branched-chain amino acid transport system substrate-binding protein